MADDSSYEAFLNKANANPSSTSASATTTSSSHHQKPHTTSTSHAYTLTAGSTSIPGPLKSIVHSTSHTYTSDTDSEWEPVLIPYSSSSSSSSSSSLPSAEEFKKALPSAATVEELQPGEFDPKNQYASILEAVKKAGGTGSTAAGGGGAGQVKIFRVQVDAGGTRVEYYIVTVSAAHDNKLVGVVANAVES